MSFSRAWFSSSCVSAPWLGVDEDVDGRGDAEEGVGAIPRISEMAEADLEARFLEAMNRAR